MKNEKDLLIEDSMLVGVDFTKGIDKGFLLVGKKAPNEIVQPINFFEGQEAFDLYKKLITKRGNKNGKTN